MGHIVYAFYSLLSLCKALCATSSLRGDDINETVTLFTHEGCSFSSYPFWTWREERRDFSEQGHPENQN